MCQCSDEIRSTPVSSNSLRCRVRRCLRPRAERVFLRFPPSFISLTDMLSSMITSAPASTASRRSLRFSTSLLFWQDGEQPLPLRSLFAMLPTASDVIILDQYPVIQAEPVIYASSGPDRIFFHKSSYRGWSSVYR